MVKSDSGKSLCSAMNILRNSIHKHKQFIQFGDNHSLDNAEVGLAILVNNRIAKTDHLFQALSHLDVDDPFGLKQFETIGAG